MPVKLNDKFETKNDNKRFTFNPTDDKVKMSLETSTEHLELEDCDVRIKVFYEAEK